MNRCFFNTLPPLQSVDKTKADIAWLIYDLERIKENGIEKYKLTKTDIIFTEFESALLSITTPTPGKIDDFLKLLQNKLDEQLESPPINKIIEKPF